MCKETNKCRYSGQTSLEFILVLGFIVIPALLMGAVWVRTGWRKNECAFQSFKIARIQMIRTGSPTTINGVNLVPLEDLDQNKGGLVVSDLLKEVSRLWEQLSSS